MSVSPPIHANSDGERQSTNSPFFPRISRANTIARPSPLPTSMDDSGAFPTVKLQAKMVKQTPLPYQTQEFKPCIVLKKFEPSVRVSDSFVPGVPADDALSEFKKRRTVILHTDRYSSHGQMRLESDTQKVRLAQEGQMLQDARSRMRLREALAHRARHDLHLGGNPIAPDQLDDDIRSVPVGAAANAGSQVAEQKKKKQRRLKKPHHQHQRSDPRLQLGFIAEEAPEASPGRRVGPQGQLVSHSSAPSIPALNLGQFRGHSQQQQQQAGLATTASFVSRAEFDALSALIGGGDPGMVGTGPAVGGLGGNSGLEKVKLDGSKAVFNRRIDILAEVAHLKAIVLPDFAKDLYVGRGIRLPGTHGLNNPKKMVNAGDDPLFDALLQRAQQPGRIIDESGNILISSSADSQQQQQQRKQVFVADVTAKPKPVAKPVELPKGLAPTIEEVTSAEHQAQGVEESQQQQQQQQQPLPQLPEPFMGLSGDVGSRDQAEDVSGGQNVEELIRQLQLPEGITAYLAAIQGASGHPRARPLTLELGGLIGQRLTASGASEGATMAPQASQLIGWLRRGLDLFHDVDREGKGSVSLSAFYDILSSMRGEPLADEEAAGIRNAYGLSGDSVSKLAFLAVLPFLQDVLAKH